MTPALALLLLGARIPVDPQGMALSITQIVLVPVLAGETAPFAASITILIIVRGSRCAPAEAMQSDRVKLRDVQSIQSLFRRVASQQRCVTVQV